MSLRNIFQVGVAACAVLGTSVAMAENVYYTPMPQQVPSNMWYYVEGQIGYAAQDYYSTVNWSTYSGIRDNNNGDATGGFTGGLDFGYAINKNIAIELGWVYLPSVNVAGIDLNNNPLPSNDLTSWVLYLAAKYMVNLPFVNNSDWFFKLGAEYRRATVSGSTYVNGVNVLPITNGTSNFVRPMFATGLEYNFCDVWVTSFQYAYYMGSSDSFPLNTNNGAMGTVDASVFTFNLGYKFIV